MKFDANESYLDRGAPADLWRRTLSQIPSTFGRLIYLSSLRTPAGTYEHFGFAQQYGMAAAQAAIMESHEEAFATWLSFNLEQQKADLDLYLAGLISEREAVIDTWLRLSPYRNLVPAWARESERKLFLSEFDMLLELLRLEHRLERPDPER